MGRDTQSGTGISCRKTMSAGSCKHPALTKMGRKVINRPGGRYEIEER